MLYYADLIFQGLINGAIYALIAAGLTMVFGLLRILHIAHAAVFAFGAYVAIETVAATGSVVLALLAAALVCGIVGASIYQLFYKPLLKRPPEIVLMASIGLFIAMQEAFRIVFGVSGQSYDPPPLRQAFSFAGITTNAAEVMVLVLTVALFVMLGLFVKHTRFGVACRATVSDPQMAMSSGISVEQVRLFTFFLGSALAGVAGCFTGILNNIVEPTMGGIPSYKAMAIVVLGGFGDVRGTLVASLLIGLVEAFGTVYVADLLDRDSIAFAVLLVILLIRPKGLFAS